MGAVFSKSIPSGICKKNYVLINSLLVELLPSSRLGNYRVITWYYVSSFLVTEWLIILNSKAHPIWPKSAQKGAQYFFPKKSHIFGKRRTIFDSPNNFYCIFIHEFFGDAKFKKKKSLKFFI